MTWKLLDTGTKARRMAEGKCVKAMVLTFPIRRARAPAKRFESAATSQVREKVLPSVASLTLNFVVKK